MYHQVQEIFCRNEVHDLSQHKEIRNRVQCLYRTKEKRKSKVVKLNRIMKKRGCTKPLFVCYSFGMSCSVPRSSSRPFTGGVFVNA